MPLLLAVLVAHGCTVRAQDWMVTTALAPHHTSQPRKLTLGKLFLTLHPGNVGRVHDVRVNYAKPFNGTQLVAAVHLPVAASHPDDSGGLHTGEMAATGHQNPGRILEEGNKNIVTYF